MNIVFNTKSQENIFIMIILLDKKMLKSPRFRSIIPISNKWQLILCNDGSLTQNLYSFTGSSIITNILRNKSYSLINEKRLRRIWLSDIKDKKLIFAQSLWYTKNDLTQELKKNNKRPIGEILIKYKKDICKEIQEIYYGNCIYLNNHFQSQEPIWGRKCKLYYKKQLLATIDEFFSPYLIYLF